MSLETRTVKLTELRAADEAHPRRLTGVAVVYGAEAEMFDFTERFQPGAFKEWLATDFNVRARFEHDELLASRSNSTLKLTDTPSGLEVEIDVAETRAGDDALALVERGDIEGMSFGFRVMPGGQAWSEEGDKLYRDIFKAELHEVTITDSPAYTDSSIAKRSVDPAAISEAKRRKEAGQCPDLDERRRQLRQQQAAA
jgi:HK97 family phage prohead protease